MVLVILMVPSYRASNSNQYYYGAAHMFGENTRARQEGRTGGVTLSDYVDYRTYLDYDISSSTCRS